METVTLTLSAEDWCRVLMALDAQRHLARQSQLQHRGEEAEMFGNEAAALRHVRHTILIARHRAGEQRKT